MTEPELPWDVAPAHRRDREVRMVRYWLRQAAGLPLTYAEQKQLEVWLRELDNSVLTYSRAGGFQYAPRTESDGRSLWRV